MPFQAGEQGGKERRKKDYKNSFLLGHLLLALPTTLNMFFFKHNFLGFTDNAFLWWQIQSLKNFWEYIFPPNLNVHRILIWNSESWGNLIISLRHCLCTRWVLNAPTSWESFKASNLIYVHFSNHPKACTQQT